MDHVDGVVDPKGPDVGEEDPLCCVVLCLEIVIVVGVLCVVDG